jgi:exodeoxyribonuclease V beta subunit
MEEILVLTFTKAATRELKERIRSNLEKACVLLRSEDEPSWPYLKPFAGSAEALKILEEALSVFDRSQIFTIHGFCYRMLKEFAFEANLGFSLADPDQEKSSSKRKKSALADFLERGISSDLLCPEQIGIVMKQQDTMGEISRLFLRAKSRTGIPLSKLQDRYVFAMKRWRGGEPTSSRLLEDFEKIRINFKAKDGDFAAQVDSLARSFQNPKDWTRLLWHRGSLFSFLDPSNRKVRQKETGPLHFPGFFEWAVEHLGPIVLHGVDYKNILGNLVFAWRRWEEKFAAEEEDLGPDEILTRMEKAIQYSQFASKVRRRYQAAVIDEFQDTDPLQWEIFRKLFLEEPLQACYLVGDPKQSIYRFRNADVYTYFAAKEFLGEQHLYHLDTNFRSCKEMIGGLNALFHRSWLSLPKLGQSIPYHPVRAGSPEPFSLDDGKSSLHWIIGDEKASFAETFLPYAAAEIERLKLPNFRSIAILVKDRHEAKKALDLLTERGVPAVAKSHQTLGETAAFQAVRELFEAVVSPQDESKDRIVAMGPFGGGEIDFSYWKSVLEEQGIVPFFRLFLEGKKTPFEKDLKQVLEALFAWERSEGFSFEGLSRFLDDFERLDSDEGGRRDCDGEEEAVQILTLHVSKGLEFDVVFALGLSSNPKEEEDEEIDAEKLRQLYVAMTRAKKRLYAPVKEAYGKKPPSPMELFRKAVEREEGPMIPYLQKLAKTESVSIEEISTPYALSVSNRAVEKNSVDSIPLPRVSYTPSFLHSFTSLAKTSGRDEKKEEVSEETLPRGTETGIAVHQIFETIFSSPTPIWRDVDAIDRIVENELRFSPLARWTKSVQEMVRKTVSMLLFDGERTFALQELEPDGIYVEMEFVYPQKNHFVKGFIDLVFQYRGRYYFLDWKTNWLAESTEAAMKTEMGAHDYGLQAALYAEALRRHIGAPFESSFGGAFYLFVRSPCYLHFIPEMERVERCYGN